MSSTIIVRTTAATTTVQNIQWTDKRTSNHHQHRIERLTSISIPIYLSKKQRNDATGIDNPDFKQQQTKNIDNENPSMPHSVVSWERQKYRIEKLQKKHCISLKINPIWMPSFTLFYWFHLNPRAPRRGEGGKKKSKILIEIYLSRLFSLSLGFRVLCAPESLGS